MSSITGKLFQVSTWGESHGKYVGVVIDGCPAGLPLSEKDVQPDLDRRRPGQSKITTKRGELDRVEIVSGLFEGKTTGTPIAMMVPNQDARSQDYSEIKTTFRPSHADFTYNTKYGFRDYKGGGRSSARETIGRVAAGAVARKILKTACKTEILAYVSRVGDIECTMNPMDCTFRKIEKSIVRCPDPAVSKRMEQAILKVRDEGDSLGGIVQLVIRNVPAGLGEPVFHRLEAELGQAMLSIPASKGFEVGSGFSCAGMRGSEHNDPFTVENGQIRTVSNFSGGIQGGISNGMPILCRIAFKPAATISQPQNTVTIKGKPAVLAARGRHDPCILPRAVVIVEAMATLTMVNYFLEQRARNGIFIGN